MFNFLFVFIGGGLGSICRYGITIGLHKQEWDFPLATFIANVISCIVLGALIALALKNNLNGKQQLMLMTGFCGGFSTFSTFSNESFQLLQSGETLIGLGYIFISLFVGLICIGLGMKLGGM